MLTSKRSRFSLPRKITYLNCAYMGPLLKTSERAGVRALRMKNNPASFSTTDFFDDSASLRAAFAETISLDDPTRVAIIPSVSYGMATVAKNIRISKGEHIIVASEQFPSNYYSWKRLCDENSAEVKMISPPNELKERGKIWNERILEAIGPKTRMVAIGHVHWADGTLFNLSEIRRRTREVSALLVVDGTQSVGALPFDVASMEPDALIVAGYKWLLGPYGLAVAYFGKEFNNGSPLEENWISRKNSENFSALVNYTEDYQDGALRYDVGERSNFIHVSMLLNSIRQINKWGVSNIQEYCKSISLQPIMRLREYGFWIEDDTYRGDHLFGVRLPKEINIDSVKSQLSKRNIFVSFRGDAIRVSPNVYNTEEDMHRLASALITLP